MIKKLTLILAMSMAVSANADVGSALQDYYNSLQGNSKIERPALTTNGASFGGYYQRGSNVDLTLGYIQPPSIAGSCGNADFNMGAFSFISGDQIVKALQAIGQNAKALLFTEAIDWVSNQLGSELKQWIAEANKWMGILKNSCQASQMLVGGLNHAMGTCQIANRFNNSISDENTVQSTCQAADQGMASIKSMFSGGGGGDDAKNALAPQISLQGGILQNMLAKYFAQIPASNEFDNELGNLVLSITGDVYTPPIDQNTSNTQGQGNSQYILGQIFLPDIFNIQLGNAQDYVVNTKNKIFTCDFTWDTSNFRARNTCFNQGSNTYNMSTDASVAGFFVFVNTSINKIHDSLLNPGNGSIGLQTSDLQILNLSEAPIFQIMQTGIDAGQDAVTWPTVQKYMTYAIHKIFYNIFTTITSQLNGQIATLQGGADDAQGRQLTALLQTMQYLNSQMGQQLTKDATEQKLNPYELLQELKNLRAMVAANVSPTIQDKLAFSSSVLRNN